MFVRIGGAGQKGGRIRLREGAEFGRSLAFRSGDSDGEERAQRHRTSVRHTSGRVVDLAVILFFQINKYSCLSLQAGPDEDPGKGDHDHAGPAGDGIAPGAVLVFAHEELAVDRISMKVSTNGSRIPFATCETESP